MNGGFKWDFLLLFQNTGVMKTILIEGVDRIDGIVFTFNLRFRN